MHLTDIFTEILYFTVVNREFGFEQFRFPDLQRRYGEMISSAESTGRERLVSDSQWRSALFAVVSWIDETVLLSDWTDRNLWQRESLQRTYFLTAMGGAEFFTRLEALGTTETAVRQIYGICLSLGFRGIYYKESDAGTLREIVERNLRIVAANDDLRIPDTLFPCAYRGEGELIDGGPRWRRWIMGTLLVAPPAVAGILYLVFQSSLTRLAAEWLAARGPGF